MSMLGKARSRPDQVAKVVQSVATNGVPATYRKVMGKLDSYTPLGYSLCGVVEQVGAGIDDVKVGDLVACAGNEHALHAELNWVPKNLYVPVPDGVAPRHAAFGTVGSIAMQGVRQGEPQLGEVALVIGLGLIGQLVVQLLAASGVRVVGVDPDPVALRAGRAAGRGGLRRPGLGERGDRGRRTHRRHGRGPGVSGGRRQQQPARRAGRAAVPGPRPGRRHRQVPARPAVERVLREGARRPVLPLATGPGATTRSTSSRAATTRSATSAGPSAATWRASSTCSPAAASTWSRWSRTSPASRTPWRRTGGCKEGELKAVAVLFRYPAAEDAAGRRGAGGDGARRCPRRRGRPGGRPRRGAPAPVRLAFVGAGNYASSMLLPHLAGPRRRRRCPRSSPPRRCPRPTPSGSSASRRPPPTSTPCSATRPSTRCSW